jgi:hypothetical protein
MARSTTVPQKQKAGPHGIVFDANVQKHWRRLRHRDLNTHLRGADGDLSDHKYWGRGRPYLEALHMREGLASQAPQIMDDETLAYHPDHGWLTTTNELDKADLGFNPCRPLTWRTESDRYSACKPSGKPARAVIKRPPRGLFAPKPVEAPRPQRKLSREEYRELALAGPIRRRRR